MNCEIDQRTGRQIHDHCYDCTAMALEWARERLSRLSQENENLRAVAAAAKKLSVEDGTIHGQCEFDLNPEQGYCSMCEAEADLGIALSNLATQPISQSGEEK